MFRDPLYRPIRRRLRELKDGNAFELCTNDLLSKIYPSLAPREGGDDAGLDGLIAKEDKNSIQLICTTGEDVIGNLTGSIKSNLAKGGTSHACILATSKRLTNPSKRALQDRAKELGRPLIQIYDQAAMAQLLYRDARWLKELLGLTGDPPSLSLFPITSRPLLDVPPLGRDDDIAKIANLTEDLVLVGQPGSGKTHLLFTAGKKAKGRFVVDEDLTRVANGVRSIQPRFLIVDDAHSRADLVKRLKHLRQEIGADYRIVASCWPGQEEAVCAALQIAKERCHALECLPQKKIKEVIQSQRIFGPPHLIAEIIHQSQGKPGLAVTLCRLCWEIGMRDVVLGTALARDVRQSFEPLLGHEAIHLLACFAISGATGMTLEAAARLCGKATLEVRRIVEQLAAAGVLDVTTQNRISVHPLRLRQAVVRDTFLKSPLVDLAPYVAETPDFAATTRVLIQAKAMGGELSDATLRERLLQLADSDDGAFDDYVHLGQQEAEWVLDSFPDKLEAVATVSLQVSPEKTIPMLLDRALATYKERSAQGFSRRVEDVMPEIKHWIQSAKPDDEDAFRRRELLAESLTKWFAAKGDIFVSVYAAGLVLSLRHEDTSAPPGEPMTVTFHFGVVAQTQLSKIASLWPKMLPILRKADPLQGSEVADIFHAWIHPSFHGKETPKEYEEESRSHAQQMMSELLDALNGEWTHHHHLHRYAEELGLGTRLKIDPIAEVLFPCREGADWRKAQERQRVAADKLAAELSAREPESAVKLLIMIEAQSRAAGISCTSWDRHVCQRIAETTDKLADWTTALFHQRGPAQQVEPFLEKIATTDPSSAETWVSLALDLPMLRVLGVCLAIKHYPPETSMWLKAKQHFKDCFRVIGGCVLRNEVPKESIRSLLRFPESAVVSSVAEHLWRDNSTPHIPTELLEDWKDAVVLCVDEDHILEGIFREFPDVAFRWIAKRLDGICHGTQAFWFGAINGHALSVASDVLTREQRKELIDRLCKTTAVSELARSLVAGDLELYEHLLSREELGYVRLDPLRIDINDAVPEFGESWQRMAIAAMQKGFSEGDILSVTDANGFGWSGSMSAMFAARTDRFEKLLHHTDPHLRKIGAIGVGHFSKLRDAQLAGEKRAAVKGEMY